MYLHVISYNESPCNGMYLHVMIFKLNLQHPGPRAAGAPPAARACQWTVKAGPGPGGNQLPECVQLELECMLLHGYIVAQSIPGLGCQPGEGVRVKGQMAASISWYTALSKPLPLRSSTPRPAFARSEPMRPLIPSPRRVTESHTRPIPSLPARWRLQRRPMRFEV